MKKLFYSLFALAAMAMTNTSCSDEMENNGTNANEAVVNFTVQLENKVGSRVAGDGTQAKKLQYWVYKAEADTIGTIINGLTGETTVNDDLTAEVSLTLVKGQTYNFLFWAQDPDCTYYTPVPAEGVITVNYAGTANDESRDAFFKVRKELKVTGPINETIVLKRPFAQINVGTSIGSLKDAKTADVDITKSSFTVNNAATRLNAYSGSATAANKVEYTLANIIESNKADNVGDLKDVDGKNYEHLAMNYILVTDYTDAVTTDQYGVGENKQLVDATFEIFDDKDALINKFDIPNVPVQRNWRTNIIGDILNETVTFNIVIDPNFDKDENGDDHNYFTEKELAYAAQNGGEVTLTEDVELEQTLVIAEGANMVINLNGHSIINNKSTGNFGEDEAIVVYGNLTIEGEGTVQSNSMAVWARGNEGAAVINIYGGTYNGLSTDLAKGGRGVVYASGGNTINIYGGTFKALAADKTSFADKSNGVYAALNIQDNKGTINVYGGSFYKFNPALPGTEPKKWNEAHPNGFVADGYAVKEEGDYYKVVEYTEVLDGTSDATLYSNVVADATIAVAAGTTLEGNDHSLTMVKSLSQYAITSPGATIKNLNIIGYNERNEDSKVIRGIFYTDPTADYVIDNVTITGVAYPLNIQATKNYVASKNLTVSSSTLVGWTSYTGLLSAQFTDCTFGIGTYFDATVAGQESWNGCIKPYVTSTFTNCKFEAGFVLDLTALKAEATLTFDNCTVNGVALTSIAQLGAEDDTRITIK